jgi:hypothetical protein
MTDWDKIFAIIDSPENDGRDYGPLIRRILGSLSNETLIKLLFTAEEKELNSIKSHINQEIERRSSDFPKS